ncbi:alpha/beta hydrolase [Crossiella sp. CA-258035]|uniref:alpha/beta hydrolase n=1 Tax=Crossiella sp. CA-258035 TaxID=2981138 RepID=UPI0024BD43EA|nr:alpha/beta hydrolase [Crossiella sp. CA-258035]WHT15688.1 alpha/beta hydrolase [Crossiella sp. CA-258035]
MTNPLPVVLVHGFWHGSWCWSPVTEQLAARGVQSVAVDLEGHGLRGPAPRAAWTRPFDAEAFATEKSPVATVTASSAAALLAEQVRAIGGGRPCLVVAHSMGGVVATALAELAPELVGGLVYVAAYAPVSGQPAAFYNTCPEAEGGQSLPLLAADPELVGAARIDFGDPDRHEEVKDCFCHDVDDRTAAAVIALLSPDGPLGIPAEELTITPERYGSVPHSYVVCTKDNAIPIALQQRFITEIDAVSAAPTTVTELDSSHSPFLSQPAALAEAIAKAAV